MPHVPGRRCQPCAPVILIGWATAFAFSASFGHPPEPPPPPAAGDFAPATLTVAGGTIDVRFAAGRPGLPRDAVLKWVESAAAAVGRYYGRFPVKRVTIEVRGGPGRVGDGFALEGRLVRVVVGSETRQADLDADWVLVHEMFHLGFPDLAPRYHWMEEGMAMYLGTVARSRAGRTSAEQFWKELVENLPHGQPRTGDEGLDNTPTWGRTYWGGCAYWFLADLEIRRQTGNRKSLDDAIRAVLDAGGDGSAEWPRDRVVSIGDKATGTAVLADLLARMSERPERTDLDALWRQLGVVYRDGRVTFDDAAPLAAVRRAVTGGGSEGEGRG